MTDWLPIESAPKNGTRIMVYNSVTGTYCSSSIDGEWPFYGWNNYGNVGIWYPVPTHWQPLPDPPK